MADTNDIVLIYIEDTPLSFARIESILPDPKKNWYQVRMLMLQLPLHVVTWILKNDYINGDEFFMNDKKMRLELVESPVQEISSIAGKKGKKKKAPAKSSSDSTDSDSTEESGEAKIFSLNDFRKASHPEEDYEPESG